MRLLLDTHVALWALADDRRLGSYARDAIADLGNAVYVSVASVWEIAIKHALGRDGVPCSAAAAIGYFAQAGYQLLDVRAEHAAAAENLPALHADPFDRMLVAQAMFEPMRLLTHDQTVAAYSDAVILI